MEMADLVAITKADSGNERQAQQAKVAYQNALHLFPLSSSGWSPQVLTCSALTRAGIGDIWQTIVQHREALQKNGFFYQKRQKQNLAWMHEFIKQTLEERFYTNPSVAQQLPDLEQAVVQGKQLPIHAALTLLQLLEQS